MSQSHDMTPRAGTQLFFENDRVRVCDLPLQPGDSTGLHRYETDYLYVEIGNGTLQGRDADGNDKPAKHMTDGAVVFHEIDGEDIHEAINVSNTLWSNIVVELK